MSISRNEQLHLKAVESIRAAYDLVDRMRRVSLAALNEARPPTLRYHAQYELVREFLVRANTMLDFAGHLGLIESEEDGEIRRAVGIDVDALGAANLPQHLSGDVAMVVDLHLGRGDQEEDEQNQELFLSVQYPPQVAMYRKAASGDEKPKRLLIGEKTRLSDAHGIAIDAKNKLLFVADKIDNWVGGC